MLPQLHIFTKFVDPVYECENMSVKNYGTHFKNNMATITDLLKNILKFKILQLVVSDLHKM